MVTDRRGFTLVEMLIVTVLGSVLLFATYQVLITNQRTYAAQAAQIQNQQVSRASLDVLFGELREVSAGAGDILGMGTDTLRVRAMRHYGLICNVNSLVSNTISLDVMKVGDWFGDADSVFVFAENSINTSSDDAWILTKVASRDTTVSCGSNDAQRLTFVDPAFALNTITTGSPVRSYTNYKYGMMTYNGDKYLGRQEKTGDVVPMVGPLKDSAGVGGVRFTYLDSMSAATTTPANVRQILVTVRTWSDVSTSQGTQVADTVALTIYPRN